MVCTRRSSLSAAEGSVDDAGASPPASGFSQRDTSSRLKHAEQLEPIAEVPDAAAAVAAATAAAAGNAEERPQQRRGRQPAKRDHPPQQQQEPQHHATQLQELAAVQGGAAAERQDESNSGNSSSGSDSGDSGDSDNDDLDMDAPDVLQSLAAAIKSGFDSHAARQQRQQQQQPAPWQQQQQAGGQEPDTAQLRWRPHTGLQLPAKAAAAAALAAAGGLPSTAQQQRRRKQQQQQQQQPAADEPQGGPLVSTAPAAAAAGVAAAGAAAAAAGALSASQPSAAAAPAVNALANTRSPLAKALHAPTLDAAARAKAARKAAPDTAGPKWFGLPAPKITEEVKRDLRLLRLRGAYDPKRFYKSYDNAKFPKYFAMGTVLSDPLEPASSRLPSGQRGASLAEQLLADAELTSSRKRRYNKLQDESQKWAKAKKRKTSMPRKKPSKHRPKH